MQEILIVLLGISSAALYGIAYYLYARQARKGSVTPNTASWIVWTIFAILNAVTYQAISGDVISNLQFISGSIACIVTFLFMIRIGSFKPLRRFEWAIVATVIASLGLWFVSGSALVANLVLLFGFALSMIPVYVGIFNNPFSEHPTPWIIWAVASGCTVTALLLQSSAWVTLITPGTLLISYLLVLLIRQYKKSRQTQTTLMA